MKKLFYLTLVVVASMLAGCDVRKRYDIKNSTLPFANSLSEAIATCKQEAQDDLSEDLKLLEKYGYARYHTDKDAIREVISIPCDTNYVARESVSRERGLDLGEICSVSSNADMRVQKLIPDEDSVDDPNWNNPTIENTYLSVVHYPCKNGNDCEKVLVSDPVRWVVRDPIKCNLSASSLKP